MGGRVGAILGAFAAAGAASEVITKTEAAILNVPLSMLLVAVAGTMIGFVLLPASDAARLTASASIHRWQQRVAYRLLTAMPLIAAVIGYSFVAAWCVQAAVGVVHTVTTLTVDQSVIIPITGLTGVGIRPWLPALLKAVERRANKVIGGDA